MKLLALIVDNSKILPSWGSEILRIVKERKNKGNDDYYDIVCVEVLRPSQPNGVMSSAVSLPNHTFTGQA